MKWSTTVQALVREQDWTLLAESQLWDVKGFLFVNSSENMAESSYLLRALQGPRD